MSTEMNNVVLNPLGEEIDEKMEDTQPTWQLQDFEIGDCLGNGKFGYVYKAVEKESRQEVAIKVICKKIVTQFEFFDQLKNEVEIHTRLVHKNIVRMYGYFYDNSYVYLIYDYISRGNLFNYIKNASRLSEKEAAKFTHDIAEALCYLKKRNIIHRDLKLENVMVDEDEGQPILKLGDFGWACQYFNEKRKTLCGTPEYLAPEMAKAQPYDFQVDVWSLGIMTYEMATGYSPFSGNETEILAKIKNYEKFENIKEQLDLIGASEPLHDFLNKILVTDSTRRLQIENVLTHPWVMINIS